MKKWIIGAFLVLDVVLLCAAGVLAVRWIAPEKNETAATEAAGSAMTYTADSVKEKDGAYEGNDNNAGALASQSIPTVKKLLKNAMKPVGKTLYIYGGGWNEADTGAGESAVTIGVSPVWEEFYNSQGADYDSSLYRYQIEKGLDCSGYVGWTIYNTLETENNQDGYVFLAERCADIYSQMGFGEKSPAGSFSDYRAGDILASPTDYHVWISLGQCGDGSVVLVNASPPGVRICGTPARDGNSDSEAVALAVKFMSEQFPDWYAKFPDCKKNMSYLTNYDRMRWDISGNGVITDPEGYCELTAEEVLTDLFMG